MSAVSFALLPGIVAMTYVWGWGVLWNVVFCLLFCFAAETVAGLARGLPIPPLLTDGSSVVTALLISICLPPLVPIGVLLLASTFAIGLVKHAYGGLGRNIFNPAMAGYAVILISFPRALGAWPVEATLDGYSGATLLTEFRYRTGQTTTEFQDFMANSISDQNLIATGFLLGGMALLFLRIAQWRLPAAVFAGIAIAALFGYDQGSSLSHGGLLFHTFSGGTIAAAFFVATDPVTHPEKALHQWLFGILIGVTLYLIRGYGAYPDGIAFAVLLANCTTPLFDRFARTQAVKGKVGHG